MQGFAKGVARLDVSGEAERRAVPALCKGGLAVHKTLNGGAWRVSHMESGMFLCTTDTRREALDRAARLLALPVDWAAGWKSPELRRAFNTHGAAIREAAGRA